ncbi:MAG: hypothetical protein OIF50_12510 [Flavobacteriaceae bacterium]|nr:hypothetical protein [Flavobacteriaceae bacterium]
MKQSFVLCLFCILITKSYGSFATDDCTDAQSNSSYILSHAKRALNSDNFEHQTYYADRSLQALQKTKSLLGNCSCKEAKDPIYEAEISLKKAIAPKDWDQGRFYTKKAIEHIDALMNAMYNCTSGVPTNVEKSSELDTTQEQLLAKQKELEAQQAALKKQQENLAKEMAKQKEIAAENAKKRAKELQTQKQHRQKMEAALAQYENAIKAVYEAMDCKDAKAMVLSNYKRMEEDLTKEGIDQTKLYYKQRAMAISQKALEHLGNCTQ